MVNNNVRLSYYCSNIYPLHKQIFKIKITMATNSKKTLYDKRVYDQAADYQYQNLLFVIISMTIVPIIFAAIFWNYVLHTTLLIWLLLSLMLSAARLILYFIYKKKRQTNIDPQKWANYFSLTSLAIGVLWGIAFLLFFESDSIA